MCEAVKDLGMKDPTVAIQGFGKVGASAAVECARQGFTILAVSDVKGGVHNPKGLDVEALIQFSRKTGGIVGFPQGEPLDDLLGYPCDILLPCAIEQVITEENAASIRARLIVEGANGPTTLDADGVLAARDILVVPDILANSGGVIVSYYEWVQNREGFYWEEEEINRRLFNKITTVYSKVKDYAKDHKRSLREAAYCIALDKIAEGMYLRGVQ